MNEELAQLCADAASVNVVDYETADAAVVDEVTRRSVALVSSALAALEALSAACGLPPGLAASSANDSPSDTPAGSDLDALAHAVALARLGLRGRQRALQELDASATFAERLAAASSALRTIQRSLSAVERAWATSRHTEPTFSFYDRALATSLHVRRRYVELHRRVTRGATPPPDQIAARLRSIGNGISELLGKGIARELRTGDRVLLSRGREEIRRWLARSHAEPFDAASGLHLFHDLANITRLFLDVSKREELVRHDALLVADVLRDPALAPAPAPPPTQRDRRRVIDRLRAMAGRSTALDTMLETPPASLSLADVRRLLEELARALGDARAPLAEAC